MTFFSRVYKSRYESRTKLKTTKKEFYLYSSHGKNSFLTFKSSVNKISDAIKHDTLHEKIIQVIKLRDDLPFLWIVNNLNSSGGIWNKQKKKKQNLFRVNRKSEREREGGGVEGDANL